MEQAELALSPLKKGICMTINEPTKPVTDPQRFSDCQEALEPYVQGIIAFAVAAKWGEIEATEAIIALAEHHVLSIGAKDEVNSRIGALKK